MTERLQQSLRDSSTARWIALLFVSLTLLAGYFFADLMSPLQDMIVKNKDLGWDNAVYGTVTGAYSWLVVMGFLILGGIFLDKSGIRLTGTLFTILMIIGGFFNYYAFTETFLNGGLGYGVSKSLAPIISAIPNFFAWLESLVTGNYEPILLSPSATMAGIGYSFFGLGIEILGIAGSRIVVKWFKGKEMALAMGLQVGIGRLGMLWVFWHAPRMAGTDHIITRPMLFGLILLVIGLLTYLVYSVMDFKLDKQEEIDLSDEEEDFKFSDVAKLFTNKAFVYIAVLCVLFYSAVFPFMKFASNLMIHKFGVSPETAGDIPGLLPLGSLFLTPIIGLYLDLKGRSASIMLVGSAMLILVHLGFAFGSSSSIIAIALMLILGVAFSLVPAAMWPAVPKIVKEQYLGSAYSLIFWIQNWGLMFFPLFIGRSLELSNPGVTDKIKQGLDVHYDYTNPMIMLAITGVLGLLFAFLLKREDKKKGYGLELPNKVN